jgi:RHS repeat-associated protein
VSGEGTKEYIYLYNGLGHVGQLLDWTPLENWQQLGLSSAADWHASRIVAAYDYDAFGRLRRADGAYAVVNPFRYSTKFQDDESGLIDFGRRFYDPDLGRWLSRDPLQEAGGLNLYAYVENNPANRLDPDGLASCDSALCGQAPNAGLCQPPASQPPNSPPPPIAATPPATAPAPPPSLRGCPRGTERAFLGSNTWGVCRVPMACSPKLDPGVMRVLGPAAA